VKIVVIQVAELKAALRSKSSDIKAFDGLTEYPLVEKEFGILLHYI
jgi:hypothetical protein